MNSINEEEEPRYNEESEAKANNARHPHTIKADTRITKNTAIKIKNTEILDAGTGGNTLLDVWKPRRFETTPLRKWYEVPIQKEKLLNWFEVIPKTITITEAELLHNGKKLRIPTQKIVRTSSDASLIDPAPPSKFYFMFYCNSEVMKRKYGEVLKKSTLEQFSFTITDWEH